MVGQGSASMDVDTQGLRRLAFPGRGVDVDTIPPGPAGQGEAQHVPLQPAVREVLEQAKRQGLIGFAFHRQGRRYLHPLKSRSAAASTSAGRISVIHSCCPATHFLVAG